MEGMKVTVPNMKKELQLFVSFRTHNNGYHGTSKLLKDHIGSLFVHVKKKYSVMSYLFLLPDYHFNAITTTGKFPQKGQNDKKKKKQTTTI